MVSSILTAPGRCRKLHLQVLATMPEFLAIRDEWDGLLARSGIESLNLSHAWLWQWLSHFHSIGLLVILIRNEEGELVGAAPLKISRTRFGLARRLLRCVQFIGSEPYVYEWMQFVHLPEYPATSILGKIAEALLEHRARWDVMDLRYALDKRQLDMLAYELRFGIRDFQIYTTTTNPYLELPQQVDQYKSCLKRNLKNNINRRLNRLRETYPNRPLQLEVIPPVSQNQVCLDTLFNAHIAYWQQRGVKSNFARFPQLRQFYRTLHQHFFDSAQGKGKMELTCLKLGNEPISTILALWQGPNYMAQILNYNQQYADYDPGTLHFDALIRHIIQNGGTCLDFGRGDEVYKSRWTDKEQTLWNMWVFKDAKALLHWQCDRSIKTLMTATRHQYQCYFKNRLSKK